MNIQYRHISWLLSLLCLCVILEGCGKHEGFTTTPVQGTVTCNGTPLTGGTIVFSPIVTKSANPGQPAASAIGPDGTFNLTTYQDGDGAIVGTHSVSILPPPATDDSKQPKFPCVDASVEVEVKAGHNESMKIELSGS